MTLLSGGYTLSVGTETIETTKCGGPCHVRADEKTRDGQPNEVVHLRPEGGRGVRRGRGRKPVRHRDYIGPDVTLRSADYSAGGRIQRWGREYHGLVRMSEL